MCSSDLAIVIDTNADEAGNETNSISADEGDGEDEGDEDVVISIGEESPPQEEEARAPEWVRELRKANREKERKIRELEAKLNAAPTETKPVALGKKPTLEDCDYDSDEYERKLAGWYEDKRLYDAAEADAQAQRDAEADRKSTRLNSSH